MPMAKYTPPSPNNVKDPIVSRDELKDTEYAHSLVDPRVEAPTALLNHVQGRSYTCDYYSQVLGAGEEPKEFQLSQSPVYQPYEKIEGFELKLSSALSVSQDQNNAFTVTGTALIYPSVIPNVGDVIIGALADGRLAQFSVSSVDVKTLYRQTVYEINFIMARMMTQEISTILNTMVVKVYRFVYDFARYGRNPLVIKTDYLSLQELLKLEKPLLNYWVKKFFSFEWNTFLVPEQASSTHDPYVTKTLRALFDIKDHLRFGDLRATNLDGSDLEHCTTIYDALLNRDKVSLEVSAQKCRLIPTRAFPTGSQYDGIRYAGYTMLVVPETSDIVVDPCLCPCTPVTALIRSQDYVTNETYPSTTNGYYVFSEAFYEQQAPYTTLEALAWDYLNGRSISFVQISALMQSCRTWPALEQYYLIPVLFILSRAAVRGYL